MTEPVCQICGTAGRACGDDHMTHPPITSTTLKGEAMPDELHELSEYEYYVGHTKLTAQLTAEQAERMGAKAPGTAQAPKVGEVDNKEAERASTHMKDADADGVSGDDPEALNKARTTRNQRAR